MQNQIMKKLLIILIPVLASATLSFAHYSAGGVNEAKDKAHPHDIVATAASDARFSTLVAAVKAAGLVEVLRSEGPFTVFAPTNEAFAKLPEGTVADLLKPENKDQLVTILTYHVVPGKVMAKDVKTMRIKTVQGATAGLEVKYGKVKIDNANVIATDIETSNGVIHVIDTVILPGAPESVARN